MRFMGTLPAAVLQAQRDAEGGYPTEDRLGYGELLFGVVLPFACLWADPGVFRQTDLSLLGPLLGPDPVFPHWWAAAWIFVTLQTGALITHAAWKPQRAIWNALFGGLFLIGALCAFGVAVVLAPLTVVGTLLMGFGLLGLVPFVTAIVFLRRGLRALGRGRVWEGRLVPLGVLAGMAVGVGVPIGLWGAGRVVTHDAIRTLEAGAPGAEDRATAMLQRWRFLLYPDDLVLQYQHSGDLVVQARLGAAYKRLTGQEIEQRIEQREVKFD